MKWLRGGMLVVLAVSLLAGRSQAADGDRISPPGEVEITSEPEQLMVSWPAVTGATGYKVQVRATGVDVEGGLGEWRSSSDIPAPAATNAVDYTIESLAADTTYQVRVYARDRNGDYGDPSGDDDATTDIPDLKTGRPAPGRVMGVTVTPGVEGDDPNSLTVSWKVVPGAVDYTVQWKSGMEDFDEEIPATDDRTSPRVGAPIGDVTEVSYQIPGLTGDKEYSVRVRARNGDDENDSDGGNGLWSMEETGRPKPGRVGGDGAGDDAVMVTPEEGALKVSWGKVTGADEYKVQWKSGTQRYDSSREEMAMATDEPSFTIGDGDLSAATPYTVRVYAINPSGEGQVSEEVTDTPKPGMVTGVTVTPGVGGSSPSLTVNWDAVPGAAGYKVQWKSGMEEYDDLDDDDTGDDRTTPPMAGLSRQLGATLVAGTEYTVRVIATNNTAGTGDADPNDPMNDDGAPSHEDDSGETGTPKPRLVTLGIITTGPGEVTVPWTAVDGADSYTVQWRREEQLYGDPSRQATTTETSYRITGLGDTPRFVRVYATNKGGDGQPSTEPATANADPGNPAGNQVTGVTVTSGAQRLAVSWDAAPGATQYKVQWWKGREGTRYSEAADEDKGEASGISRTGYTITGLDADTEYGVQVLATVDGTEGTASIAGHAWTEPSQVTGVSLTPGVGTLAVSWTDVTEATGYKVQWKTGSEDWKTSDTEISGTPYTIMGLGGTEYRVRVIATNPGGDGDPSVPAPGTPLPDQVENVMVGDLPRSLKVTWDEETPGATGYVVQWRVDGTTEWESSPEQEGEEYTIGDLKGDGTTYNVQVYAKNASGAKGTESTSSDGNPTPGPVAGVTVTPGSLSLTIEWRPVQVIDGASVSYRVQWKSEDQDWDDYDSEATTDDPDDRTESGLTVTSFEIGSGTPVTNTSLMAANEYTVRVVAVIDADDGMWSMEEMGRPQPGKVGGETNTDDDVTVTALERALDVSWGVVPGATGFTVQWKSGNDPYHSSRQGMPSGTETSYEIRPLTAGTEYSVRVIATNASGPGEPSHAEDQDPDGVPGTPKPGKVTGVRVTPGVGETATSLTVNWNRVPDATGYKVQWRETDDWKGWDSSSIDSLFVDDGTVTTSPLGAALTADTEYTVRVIATNDPLIGTNNSADDDGPPSDDATGNGRPKPGKVGTVTSTAGTGEVLVSWNPIMGADNYTVEWKPVGQTNYRLRDTTTDPSYRITGLGSADHMVRVYATNPSGSGDSSEEITVSPDDPAAGQVTGVTVDPGVEELMVTWDRVTGATGYHVQWNTGGSYESPTKDAPTTDATKAASGLRYTIEDLTAGTTYNVRVYAIVPTTLVSDGYGEPSDGATGTPKPGKVTGVTVTSADAGELTVSWTAVPPVTGVRYAVQWRTSSQDYSEVRCVFTQPGMVSYTLDMATLAGESGGPLMVDPGTQYWVRVFAQINSVDGEPSEERSNTPRPGQVTNVKVTPGAEELTVTWDPVDGSTGYTVQWKSGDQDWDSATRQASGSQITGESHTIGSLMGGTQYSVRVFASNPGGDGAPSATELGIPKPGQVTGVTVTPGSGALMVTWTALTGVDDYKVQWKLATDAEYDPSTNQDLATGTSHTIANLDPGTQYTVHVIATTEPAANLNNPEVHDGEPSEEIPGTTAPGQVVNVSVVPGVEQLTVSWEAAQGATGYKVQWKSGKETFDDAETADPKREVSGSDITGTSHTIQDLTAETEYTVRVIAYNASGDGAPSEEKKDTPKELQPGQVANVTVTPGAGELMVSWDPVEGATGYTVQWKSETDADYDASRQASGSDITGRSHTIQDLMAGTEYTVRVKASLTSGDEEMYSDEAFETPLERPAQVANVVVTPAAEQLMVSWMAAQGATGYMVQWKSGEETFDDAATADPKREASGPDITGTSYTIEDLTAGTQYTVQVIATGALVGGEPSTGEPSTEVLGTPTPGMVVEVRVSQGTGRLTVSWPEVPGATGYKVEWKSGDQAFATDRERLVTTRRHVITGLTPGTEYTVQVTAALNGVEGPASELAMGTPTRATVTPRPDPQPPRQPQPPTQPPTQPQPQPPAAKPPAVLTPPIVNHVSLNAVDGGLQVRWLSLAKAGYKGPVTGYKVQWKSGSQSYASAREDTAAGPLTWIYHTVSDLSHETEYTVRVLAFNEHGDGPASQELTGTPKEDKPSTRIAGILRGAVRGSSSQQPRGDRAQQSSLGLGPTGHLDAGQEVTLTVSVAEVAAYVLEVTGGRGITLTGDGVTDEGGGRARLDAESWSDKQQRTVVLKDTAAVDTLSVALLDTDGDQVAALGPKIVYNPEVRHGIRVTGLPDTLTVNRTYTGDVSLLDRYGNVRVRDDREVVLSANQAGVSSSPADLTAGTGEFWVRSDSLLTRPLVLTFRDSEDRSVSQTETVVIRPLDAPDELVAADNPADEGGFVLLTWDLSVDHSILDGYRIFRTPINGEPMEWGRVAADPEAEEGRAVVATLDTVTTAWGIAAELELDMEPASGGDTPVTPPPDDPEEPPTVGRSSSITLSSGIVLATPEPPMMEEEDPDMEEDPEMDPKKVRRSSVTRSGSVRAVDNVAPSAVRSFRAVDAPDDDGGRILLTWEGSLSDSLVNRRVEGAIGPTVSDMSRGVAGYRIYRQPAEEAFALLDTVGRSATSFVDTTAVNGERFTYTVAAFDEDNETHSPEESAMAIRNNEVDVNGQAITGLFGADRQVGFDDYFHFADHYGSTAADVEWEPAFDLASKQAVGEAGLNVFAENFGRQTAAAAKAPALRSGRNEQTRLDFFGDVPLPRVGEEFVLTLHLSDFTLLKGYGFQLEFNGEELEVVRAVAVDNGLGEGPLALPQVLGAGDGKRAIVAHGDAVSEGTVAVDLVFRALQEFESGFIRVTEGQVRDGTFAVNALALPAPVEMETLPEVYALGFNYPNPFNPETTIKYALPQASDVELVVYNSLGQKVRTLVSEHQGVGRYAFTWDATNDRGHAVSSGIYLYRLQAGEFAQVRKMLLLK